MSVAPPTLRALLLALLLLCPALARAQGAGSIAGRVFDGDSGEPIAGVSVVVVWLEKDDSGQPRQELRTTDAKGAFEFAAIPAGTYTIGFTKSGYRASNMANFEVVAGQVNRADFPMPKLPTGTAEQVLELDAFVVEASTVQEDMASLELRMDADQLLNTMSAEDLSRFAASDVADALKRVAGVNVVGGQFAVIRGLEDRYNNTLYNSAPVPSPDPDSQSVQLDLFPSDVVSNLVVAKTFTGNLPSNTSGGLINIITHDYPAEFEIKLSAGTGFEDRALDRFLRYDADSPIGREVDGTDVLENEFGGSIGGRKEFFEREFRFKGLVNRELDFRTAEGFQESREPAAQQRSRRGGITRSGDLALGELSLSGGRFDLTESERSEQGTGYLGFGFDIDEAANHKIDASVFYTKKDEETVQLKEFGTIPGFDYSELAAIQQSGGEINANDSFDGAATLGAWIARDARGSANDAPSRGPLWFSSFFESESFERKRDLRVFQANGDHVIEPIEGLHLTWAANQAKTTQEENAIGARYFYEPTDVDAIPTTFPTTPDQLGAGRYYATPGIFQSINDIDEEQDFARFDIEYEFEPLDVVRLGVNGGFWYESASRDVESSFLESPTVGGSSQFAIPGDDPAQLGNAILEELDSSNGDLEGVRDSTSEASRDITAWNVGGKATFWDRVDLLASVRREKIKIESLNEPFTGELRFGAPAIFPEAYLFFDRLDNVSRLEVSRPPPPGTVFNDEILGVDVPIDPATGLVDLLDRASIESLINGEIDETLMLPAFGVNVRPIEGLTLRAAYSQTVARPSFRELGFYVSVEPGTDDLFVGNPQLQLSDVESWDLRAEYTWGSRGDLVAASLFMKEIDDPIESIVVRNPVNAEASSSALFRTFFNNPNQGKVRGIEVEARKSLDFFGVEALEYVSIGGNFTYIDAEVDRTEAELARSGNFFGVVPGENERFRELEQTRRLFGQPEWIANADISFDHPDWGTKVTLSFFAISDVLDAAGSASLNNGGEVIALTLDRYVDSFNQLDFTLSQKVHVERLRGDLTFKFSAKNLTDSSRGIIYDPSQTRDEIAERSFKVGRDFSFSLTYTF
jgi:outer membrane receptor protein involved in Fe transport